MHSEYIDFTYLLDNNVYYVTEIKYGSNSTQYGAVKFTYQTRSDVQSSYIAGRLMKDSKLLSKIDTYYQSSILLSTYTLSYDTSIYSFLSKLSLKSNGKEVNPLMFYYGGESDESLPRQARLFLKLILLTVRLLILSCIRVSLILLPGVRDSLPILILNLMV